jgi:hypothetical protein
MKARVILILFGIAFFVTLAIIIGQRLSSEAMAVMVGVLAGVVASVPTSLIVMFLLTRLPWSRPEPPTPPETRVVMMAPPAPGYDYGQPVYGAHSQQPVYPALPVAPPARSFTVIGGADVELDEPQLIDVVPRRR